MSAVEYKEAALKHIGNPELREKISNRIDGSDDMWIIAAVLSAVVAEEMKNHEGLATTEIRNFIANGVTAGVADKRLQQIEDAIKALREITINDDQTKILQLTAALKKEISDKADLIIDSVESVKRVLHSDKTDLIIDSVESVKRMLHKQASQAQASAETPSFSASSSLSVMLESRGLIFAVAFASLLSLATGFFAGYSMGDGKGRQAAEAAAVRVVQQALKECPPLPQKPISR